jgi:hypothetical protein
MPRTKMLKLTMFAGVLLTALLVIGSAQASVCTITSPTFFASFTLNPSGTLGPGDCTSVVQQDKDYTNFAFTGLPTGTTVQFSFAVVFGEDVHTVTFLAPFGSTGAGASFNWSYDISVVPGFTKLLRDVAVGVDQGRGTVTLAKDLVDNHGNHYSINFTQVNPLSGPPTITGTTMATFLPGVTSLTVADTLTIGSDGSNTSAVSNSYTQYVTPEPASLALFGSGILGLAGLLRRKKTL